MTRPRIAEGRAGGPFEVVWGRDAVLTRMRRQPGRESHPTKHNRRTAAGQKLFDVVRASESSPVGPRAGLQLHVDRQSARPKKSKQKARPGRVERIADMTLRFQPTELRPPDPLGDKAPIPVWIVHIVEEQPPAGVKPNTAERIKRAPAVYMVIGWRDPPPGHEVI